MAASQRASYLKAHELGACLQHRWHTAAQRGRGNSSPQQVAQEFCQQASADARLHYALKLPLEKELQSGRQSSGTLTATQRCSGGIHCGHSPALVWSACLAFDGNLAVRRDVTMSSALPASNVAGLTDAQADHGCHCDMRDSGSAFGATDWRALGFGTIRAVAGAWSVCLLCLTV